MALNLEQQQQQLYKLNAELSNLKKEQASLKGRTQSGLLKKFDPKLPSNKLLLKQLSDKTDQVNTKQTEYNALKKTFDEAKADTKVVSEVGSADEARKAALAGYGPDEIQKYRDDLAAQLKSKKDKQLAEKNAKDGQVQSEEQTQELATAGPFVYQTLDGQGRKDLATQLNAIYGTSLPISETPSKALKEAYTQLLLDRFQRSQDEGKNLSVTEFIKLATVEGTYKGAGGPGKPDLFASISDPTQAASIITSVFKSELNRDPTAAELTKYTKQLQSAERRNPFKTVDGIRTGGLDKSQFIVGELQKLPEFAQKKTDKASLTSQSLLGTAKANGLTLGQDQINNFTQQIQNGTDIKVIQNQIRSIASSGMPDNVKKLLNEGIDLDTVYSPYKNVMAQILELNPDSIDLKDPTLRLAFGPDKETTIYDFEKALRKDYRWQYTDNAKRDVSNVALKVLQDFGFQA